MLNNLIYENNNNILFSIVKNLENIITDLNSHKQINNIITQIKNIMKIKKTQKN